jgi:hypothetical protein
MNSKSTNVTKTHSTFNALHWQRANDGWRNCKTLQDKTTANIIKEFHHGSISRMKKIQEDELERDGPSRNRGSVWLMMTCWRGIALVETKEVCGW